MAQPAPRFGAQASKPQDQLGQYETGWKNLIQWDQKAHSIPVLSSVKLPELLKAAATFLQRQNAGSAATPTPFMIGMAGGTASGKTTIKQEWLKLFPRQANRLAGWTQKANGPITDNVELDNYYRDFSKPRAEMGDGRFFFETNLDTPDTVKLSKAARHLTRIKNGQAVRMPSYSFSDSSNTSGQQLKTPAPFFVAEGIFTFVPPQLRKLFDLTVFVDASEAVRGERWWKRAAERKLARDKAGLAMFNRGMTEHNRHVEPTKDQAQVVINSAAPLNEVRDTLRRMTALLVKTFYPAS